jgi:nucleotide-binding universal stress UspA family protein
MSSTPFRRILIPIDFTDDADDSVHSGLALENETSVVAWASIKALELAVGILSDGGSLCLVHATPSYDTARVHTGGAGMGLGMGELAEVHANARSASLEVLEKFVQRYAAGVDCTFVVRPGVALQVILEEATKLDAELIVIPASGRSRVARFFLGSTADRVIRQSPCPVLVVPSVPTPE